MQKNPNTIPITQVSYEELLSIAFLLKWQYKGNMSEASRCMNVSVARLKQARARCETDAEQVMKENYPELFTVDAEKAPPIEVILDKALRRLNNIIDDAKQPDKLTSAVYKLFALQKLQSELSDQEIDEEDIYNHLNETLMLGIKEVKEARKSKTKKDEKD